MEVLARLSVFSLCFCVCYSQMSQLEFQRALQDRLNAMRTFLTQRLSENGINSLPDSGGTSSSTDMFRQLFGLQGIVPPGGTQTSFNRQSRSRPNVVTLNGPNDSNLLNSRSNNNNNNNIVRTRVLGNSNPANDMQVIVVNQNQGFSSSGSRDSIEENRSSNFGASDMGNSQSGILLPDSVVQANTSILSSPFSFPTSSASFWMSSSNRGSVPVSPTQPSSSDSSSSQGSMPSGFVSIFSGSPGASFSRVTTSSNQESFDPSTWNRFMTGSESFNPTSSTSDMAGSTNTQGSDNSVMNSTPAGETSTNFDNSQPVTFIKTASGGSEFNQAGTTFSRESITTQEPALKCTEEFKNLAGHTLCMTDDGGVSTSGVTPADKQMITEFHNDLRSRVMPPAEDLMKLKWDERLAAVADKWAKQCTLGHDKERTIPDIGISVGQNVAVGYRTWRLAIQTWYDEVQEYRYGYQPDSYLGPGGWRSIAHYTQIVHNSTQLIGCGYAECPNTQYVRYYVCNYASGQSEIAFPYTAGSRCGKCMNNCNNGLCDCGDLVCYNTGELDPNTCTCRCPKSYKGRSCETLDCPAQDNWICGRDWPASFCDLYSNVKEECPYMCGVCSGGTVPVVAAPNQTFTSDFGCTYSGLRGTTAECLEYGNKGADMLMCQSEGGSVGCGECERYFNIKRDYCPVMCGLCDPPCKGMKCSNGGTLDTGTCKCSCRLPFTGDTCEYAQCPVNGDPAFCQFWPRRYCRLYYNVPEECPYMCGICKKDSPEGSGNTSRNKNGGRRKKK